MVQGQSYRSSKWIIKRQESASELFIQELEDYTELKGHDYNTKTIIFIKQETSKFEQYHIKKQNAFQIFPYNMLNMNK